MRDKAGRMAKANPASAKKDRTTVASDELQRHMRTAMRGASRRVAGSLVRRVVVVNLAGLIALLGAVLYINQFREGLIESRIGSLFTQGEIIAAAIAASATIQTDSIALDPDKLLMLQSGQTAVPEDDDTEF
jgi:two-component system sensor histidine kinase ChvG